ACCALGCLPPATPHRLSGFCRRLSIPALATPQARPYAWPMAIHSLAEFRAAIAPGKRLLGLDVGEKTIGVAIADSGFSVATPVETIRRTRFAADAERLRALIAERGIGGLRVRLPLHIDRSDGPR